MTTTTAVAICDSCGFPAGRRCGSIARYVWTSRQGCSQLVDLCDDCLSHADGANVVPA